MNGNGFGWTDTRSEPCRGFKFGRWSFAQEKDDTVLFILIEHTGRLEDALSGGDAA
jgi:hypothetical protein